MARIKPYRQALNINKVFRVSKEDYDYLAKVSEKEEMSEGEYLRKLIREDKARRNKSPLLGNR